MSQADVASFETALAIEFPSLGSFSAAGTLAPSESSGMLLEPRHTLLCRGMPMSVIYPP